MRLSIVFVIQALILINSFPKFSLGSYDTPYGQGPAPPIAVSQHPVNPNTGWNSAGQASGSYYHYHVPLVGQQQQPSHYPHQPATSNTDLHHHLLWLIPLLLLVLAPLAFLPLLLKLLLVPVGLSLLALLLPLLMMGGMMMMMMMGGGMMMPMMRNPANPASTARTLGQLLVNDWSSVFSTVGRAIDFDSCPEKLSCELGSLLFPKTNSTGQDTSDQQGELISKYIVEQLLPRGKVKKMIRQYKNAFWTGSKSQNCESFICQPKFRSLFQSKDAQEEGMSKTPSENHHQNQATNNESKTASTKINNVKYSYSQVSNHSSTILT